MLNQISGKTFSTFMLREMSDWLSISVLISDARVRYLMDLLRCGRCRNGSQVLSGCLMQEQMCDGPFLVSAVRADICSLETLLGIWCGGKGRMDPLSL